MSRGYEYHEYRATATVTLDDDGPTVNEVRTEWDSRRDFVIRTAEALRDDGYHVQIESRPLHQTTHFGEVPR